MKPLVLLFCLLGPSLHAAAQPAADLFVSPKGSDSWSGKLAAPNPARTDGPFASIARAQAAVRELPKSKPVTILLRGGTYYLPLSPTNHGTLTFTATDSGAAAAPITWQNYPGETPVVSGGVPVTGWNNPSANLWQVKLPANTQPFAYLFYNGERRLRARVQSAAGVGYYMRGSSCYSTVTKEIVDTKLCDVGTYLRIASEITPTGDNAGCPSATSEKDASRAKCLDRFQYNPDDPITTWANLNPAGSKCGGASNSYPVGDVELMLFDAWTVDAMRVSCVDTNKHLIYLTAPTKGVGHVYNFFGPLKGHRYIVENARDAFEAARSAGETALWFLDRSTSPWTLNYLANQDENPGRDNVVIAQVAPVSQTGGSLLIATGLQHVTFRGLTFEVDNYVVSATGFNKDENSDDTLPEALDCESCQNVTFDGIAVRHTSASAILIASTDGRSGPPAANDVIRNSAFYDIGDCGIRIGHHFNGADKPASSTQFIRVENNIVQGYSRVFPDGEGLSLASGRDVTFSHNDITDGYHAGASICMLGCSGHAANGTNIITEYNHIWNTTQGVTSDGGTLYYNVGANGGSGTGNKILSNLIHDTTDSSIIDQGIPGTGYGGAGIYLDIQSTGFQIENNVVYNVAAEGIFMADGPVRGQSPHTFKNNIIAYARSTMFRIQFPWSKGCVDPFERANLLNNIFYFDRDDTAGFYVTQTCGNSCGLDYNKYLNFQGNLYWRTDGSFATYNNAFSVLTNPPADPGTCAYVRGPAKAFTFLTFKQWQSGAMKEDTQGSATVDPKFGHTGKPADFLLKASPLAGFDHAKTNDTIRQAGRNHPIIHPPQVRHTFPTYSYTSY